MILIADEMHPSLMENLKANQIPFNYQPTIKPNEAVEIMGGYQGIVVRSKCAIDKNFIDNSPQLKFIARAGSGTDSIDADYAAQKSITIINTPEALADAVAEHTIGLILALLHKIVKSNIEVKNRIWKREENRGFELMNSTVGIIGYGHTGSAVAKKLNGFGVTVLAYDKYKIPLVSEQGEYFFDAHATSCTLETIYEKADLITLHVPLTMETMDWVNKKFFDQFKKPIILINCARGKIVNTFDLTQAMDSGRVIAAGLDVLEEEPPFNGNESTAWFNSIQANPRVIITPHVAGWSSQSYERISRVLSDKIIEFLIHKGN